MAAALTVEQETARVELVANTAAVRVMHPKVNLVRLYPSAAVGVIGSHGVNALLPVVQGRTQEPEVVKAEALAVAQEKIHSHRHVPLYLLAVHGPTGSHGDNVPQHAVLRLKRELDLARGNLPTVVHHKDSVALEILRNHRPVLGFQLNVSRASRGKVGARVQ